jgi:hypothetical protein
LNNSEFAGNPLEPKTPERNSSSDLAISRDKLAWLAGLLDGEGYIGINIWRESKTIDARIKFRPSIQMSITDFLIYQRFVEIMEEMGIKNYVRLYKQDDTRKMRLEVMVVNRKNVSIVLNAIRPFVTRLAEYCDIVLQFIMECESTDHYKDKDKRHMLAMKYDSILKKLRQQALPPETTKEHLKEMMV